MTYQEALEKFSEQLSFEPQVKYQENIKAYKNILVLGMGGSRLAPDFIKLFHPELDIHVHSDYNLPNLPEAWLNAAIIIANSHSGSTEETISGAKAALAKGYNLAVVTTGGELAKMAEENKIPHVLTPSNGMPARLCTGYSLGALMAVLKIDRSGLRSVSFDGLADRGSEISAQLKDSVPLIYVPDNFSELGYYWKVVLNETAKIPAFYNRLPEADHNEISGFDGLNRLYSNFKAVMILDPSNEKMSRRADATSAVWKDANLAVEPLVLTGQSSAERVLVSAVLAHWTAFSLAQARGADPLANPNVDKLKQLLK